MRFTSTILCIIASSSSAWAVDTVNHQIKKLTLDQAINQAIHQNKSLSRLKQQIEVSRADIDLAKAGYIPSINASAAWTKSQSLGEEKGNGVSRSFGAKVAIPLFSGFKTKLQVDQSEVNLEKHRFYLNLGELKTLYDLETQFSKLIFNQQSLALTREIAKRLENQYTLMRLKYQSGQEAKWAVTKAQADWQDGTLQIAIAEDNRRTSVGQIKILMNDADPADLEATGDLQFDSISDAPDIQSLIETNPEIMAMQRDERSASLDVAIAKSNYWPDVAAFAGYQKSLDKPEDKDGLWTVGIEATIPLYGATNAPAVRKSREVAQIKIIDLEERRQTLALELMDALRQYKTSVAALGNIQLKLESTQQRAVTINQEYTAGLRTFIEWEQAQQQLIQAEKSALSLRYDASRALAELKFKSNGKLP